VLALVWAAATSTTKIFVGWVLPTFDKTAASFVEAAVFLFETNFFISYRR
jgi:hypothetical protein